MSLSMPRRQVAPLRGNRLRVERFEDRTVLSVTPFQQAFNLVSSTSIVNLSADVYIVAEGEDPVYLGSLSPQSTGSLAVNMSGRLYASSDGTNLTIHPRSWLDAVQKTGPFQPGNVAADAAGQIFVFTTIYERVNGFLAELGPGTGAILGDNTFTLSNLVSETTGGTLTYEGAGLLPLGSSSLAGYSSVYNATGSVTTSGGAVTSIALDVATSFITTTDFEGINLEIHIGLNGTLHANRTNTPYVAIMGPKKVVQGEPLTYTFRAFDNSVGVTNFTYAIDWNGDNVVDQTFTNAPSEITVDHIYTTIGSNTIRCTITDAGNVSGTTGNTLPVTVSEYLTRANPFDGNLVDLVYGAPAAGSIRRFSSPAENTITIRNQNNSTNIATVAGITGDLVFFGQGGNEQIIVSGLHGMRAYLAGGDDAIKGSADGGGTYTIDGGDGNDSVLFYSATDANVSMTGGAGNDSLAVAAGSNGTYSVTGNAGNDQLILLGGTNVNLAMDGGDGDDKVTVGGDNGGSMTLSGGAGFDGFFIYGGNNLVVTVNGGDEDDTVVNAASNSSLNVDLGGGADFLVNLEVGNMTVLGGSGDDIIAAIAGADSIDGGSGNDLLVGGVIAGDGNDTILGGDGNDVIVGGDGADSLNGGNNEDLVLAGLLSDIYFGEEEVPGVVQVWLQWNSADSFATRKAYLTGTSGGIIQPAFYMVPGSTVLNDSSVDTVLGGSGADWLLYNFATDIASDYSAGTDARTNI